MRRVLITGSAGFIGKNLRLALSVLPEVEIYEYDVDSPASALDDVLAVADVIFHLAGVNRPREVSEFAAGNTGFTELLCAKLTALGRAPKIVMSSSIQAELDNPYGQSKREAEEALQRFAETGADVVIYRLPNVFGKWCRPNYNSVVATFCHNIARDLPITISNPEQVVTLIYIDDIVAAWRGELDAAPASGARFAAVPITFQLTLQALAEQLRAFRAMRTSLVLPDLADPLVRRLYGAYISYLDENDFAYNLEIKTDNRGSLAEFIKSPTGGQLFISRTKPGITRGNHYHHTKSEKFMVVEGDAIIRFRHLATGTVLEYPVSGTEYRAVDIPTGYTHSIENVGQTELVVLFWATEIFDPAAPDTLYAEVKV